MSKFISIADHRQRLRDVAEALESENGFAWLAGVWSLKRQGAYLWCRRHIADSDFQRLAESGRLRRGLQRPFVLADRLALLDLCRSNGWTLEKIGRAIGCAPSNICHQIKQHAPHGFQEALADYAEDEAA